MNANPKLSLAIATILGGSGIGIAYAADTTAADTEAEGIPEIQVTAQRRNESLEDVPITIQAVTGEQLKTLNVTTFDDLLKYTPNVTYAGNNPGGGNIFIRGLSAGGNPNQSQSTTAPFPNVASYLDDESLQYPGRNIDVYLVDMERVEVLEGPQGTLFGGGAQAGAIRYITNKPKLNVTEGDVNASYGITAGGDPNTTVNAMINLPLVPDVLAARAVIFEDHRGGYIDNVPGQISFGSSPVANNSALVQQNQNPVTYDGVRLEALWQINDDWSALITQNYQNMRADGYYNDYPISTHVAGQAGTPLGPNQIDAFTPAYNNDRYESTSWTVSGKFPTIAAIGDIKAVYTGSYLDRHIEQQADYSSYLVSGAGSAYTCTGAGASFFKSAKPTTCYAPVGDWNDQVRNTHQSHEVRLQSDDANRIRTTVGGFWEDFKIYDNMNYDYLPIPQCSAANLAISAAGGPDCTSAVGPPPGTFANDPNLRVNSNTAFGEDVERGYRQAAAFASLDFDIIPKVLTVSGGIRYFHYDEFERGSEYYTESLPASLNALNGVCTAAGGCGFGINLNKTESGKKERANISWHITPDMMLYYTYSEGFRPGGFNRTASTAGGAVSLGAVAPYTSGKATDQYYKPAGYNSDNLLNNEIGFKSTFFEHRLEINASAYRMQWSNVQVVLFDPVHLGNTTFVTNGPSYSITGFELQAVARVWEGLTIQGSGSWNSSAQVNAPCLTASRATAAGAAVGTCITQVNGAAYTNPYGLLGAALPFSPSQEWNLRARYDFNINDYKPWVGFGANHIGSMSNEPASYPDGNSAAENPPTTTLVRYDMPGYTTYDASVGVAKDNWLVQFTGNNLTNSDASTMTSSGGFIKQEVPLRPRVLTFGFGYKF
jgi:iron complex outermembrane recepter protein